MGRRFSRNGMAFQYEIDEARPRDLLKKIVSVRGAPGNNCPTRKIAPPPPHYAHSTLIPIHAPTKSPLIAKHWFTRPSDVLNYWFGDGMFWDNIKMADTDSLPIWWWNMTPSGEPFSTEERAALDEDCRTKFAELVRACGRGELTAENDEQAREWDEPHGLYAQLLLCDQLSRNCFRGSPEASAYDMQALEIRRRIFNCGLLAGFEEGHFIFLVSPGTHSEDIADHEMSARILAEWRGRFGEDALYRMIKSSCDEHMEVIQRFGRYPHRNQVIGRESTEEEKAWLADEENLPVWAKFQL